MFSCALDGHEVPIVYKGKITGNYREKNIEERKFILKGLKPQYRDSFSLINSAGPAQVVINLAGSTVTPALQNASDPVDAAKIINPEK